MGGSIFATALRRPVLPAAAASSSPTAVAATASTDFEAWAAAGSGSRSSSGSVNYGLESPAPSGAGGAVPAVPAAAATATAAAAATESDAAGSLVSVGVNPAIVDASCGVEGDNAATSGVAKTQVVEQPWVAVGGSWRDEDNVCGYWRFSEGSEVGHQLGGAQKVTGVCPMNYILRKMCWCWCHCFFVLSSGAWGMSTV